MTYEFALQERASGQPSAERLPDRLPARTAPRRPGSPWLRRAGSGASTSLPQGRLESLSRQIPPQAAGPLRSRIGSRARFHVRSGPAQPVFQEISPSRPFGPVGRRPVPLRRGAASEAPFPPVPSLGRAALPPPAAICASLSRADGARRPAAALCACGTGGVLAKAGPSAGGPPRAALSTRPPAPAVPVSPAASSGASRRGSLVRAAFAAFSLAPTAVPTAARRAPSLKVSP